MKEAGWAGLRREGMPEAEEVCPWSGQCVAVPVATAEVGGDRGVEPLRLPSSPALEPQQPPPPATPQPVRVADPGEPGHPVCGPGPPAALQA